MVHEAREPIINPDFGDVPSIIKVAGVSATSIQDVISNMFVGELIEFRRDYKNEYDSNAVAVIRMETGEQIGWIPRDDASIIAPYIDAGFIWDGRVESILGGGAVNYGLRIRLL